MPYSNSMCAKAEAPAGVDSECEAVGTRRGPQRGEATERGNTGLQDHGTCRQPNREPKLKRFSHSRTCSLSAKQRPNVPTGLHKGSEAHWAPQSCRRTASISGRLACGISKQRAAATATPRSRDRGREQILELEGITSSPFGISLEAMAPHVRNAARITPARCGFGRCVSLTNAVARELPLPRANLHGVAGLLPA
jgi:hypothetical protein